MFARVSFINYYDVFEVYFNFLLGGEEIDFETSLILIKMYTNGN